MKKGKSKIVLLTHQCVFAHSLQRQREILGQRTGGTNALFLALVAALVIVVQRQSAVPEVKSDVNPILSLSPVGLAWSPG